MPPKRPSAGAAGPSTQRRRVQEEVEDDISEEELDDIQAGEESRGAKGGLSNEEIKSCAGKLVRLALFYEYQRKVIRRDVVFQKVIPSKAKNAFPTVFNRSQTILRQTFGMELVELRMRNKASDKNTNTQAPQTQAQTQGRKQSKGKKRASGTEGEGEEGDSQDDQEEAGVSATQGRSAGKGSKTYIVRSCLPADTLALMSKPAPLPMFDDAGNALQADDDYVDSGALIPWEKADGTASGNVALLGVRTVILCIIMCQSRAITDDHLHALLKRLNLNRDTLLPYLSPDSKEAHLTLDKYLDVLARQQYLEKTKIPGPTGGLGEGASYEWSWGNREAEFSEAAAAAFIEDVLMGGAEDDATVGDDDEDESEEEDEGRNGRRDRQGRANGHARPHLSRAEQRLKKRERIRKDIGRAMGGEIIGQV